MRARMVVAWMHRLRSAGVFHVGIAPGSRSTALVVAAASVFGASQLKVHYDERGLGFWALGIGKSTKRPAAVIVTSGTAVANLLPAVIEAHYSGTPLLILSADRPFELIDVGANQAIRQTNIFTDWTVFSSDLHPPSDWLTQQAWLGAIDRAMAVWHQGPVHLNLRFREPLWEPGGQPPVADGESGICRTTPLASVAPPPSFPVSDRLGRVLVIIGEADYSTVQSWIDALNRLGGTMVLDGISGAFWVHPNIGLHSEWIDHLSDVDTVIHLGGKLLSKSLNAALSNWTGRLIHWTQTPRWQNPSFKVSHWIVGSVTWAWVDQVDTWVSMPTTPPNLGYHTINQLGWSELVAMVLIHTRLPHDWVGFIGNSMPIRLWAMTRCMASVNRIAFANRGASGIDGLVATATGISMGIDRPVLAVLGDLSALHDTSSFALWSKLPHAILVIFNNSGGGIFNQLPIRNYEWMGPLFRADHAIQFDGIAKSFGCLYARSDSFNDAEQALAHALETPGAWILEWTVDGNQTRDAMQRFRSIIEKEI